MEKFVASVYDIEVEQVIYLFNKTVHLCHLCHGDWGTIHTLMKMCDPGDDESVI